MGIETQVTSVIGNATAVIGAFRLSHARVNACAIQAKSDAVALSMLYRLTSLLRLSSLRSTRVGMTSSASTAAMTVNAGIADVHMVNMFDDNYGYILVDRSSGDHCFTAPLPATLSSICTSKLPLTPVVAAPPYLRTSLPSPPGDAAVVDPGDPEPVLSRLAELGLTPRMVLCTHKHADHSGGNVVFKQRFPELEVVGTQYEPIAGLTVPVAGMVHTPACPRAHMSAWRARPCYSSLDPLTGSSTSHDDV